jgi:hypothetical protein
MGALHSRLFLTSTSKNTDYNMTDEEKIKKLRDQLEVCCELLNEVRTGSDFETECWRAAEKGFKILEKTGV